MWLYCWLTCLFSLIMKTKKTHWGILATSSSILRLASTCKHRTLERRFKVIKLNHRGEGKGEHQSLRNVVTKSNAIKEYEKKKPTKHEITAKARRYFYYISMINLSLNKIQIKYFCHIFWNNTNSAKKGAYLFIFLKTLKRKKMTWCCVQSEESLQFATEQKGTFQWLRHVVRQ